MERQRRAMFDIVVLGVFRGASEGLASWEGGGCQTFAVFFFGFTLILDGKTIVSDVSAGFCFTFGPKMVNIIEPFIALRFAHSASGRRDQFSRHQPDNSNDWIVDQGAKTIAMWLCFIRYIMLSSLVNIN